MEQAPGFLCVLFLDIGYLFSVLKPGQLTEGKCFCLKPVKTLVATQLQSMYQKSVINNTSLDI